MFPTTTITITTLLLSLLATQTSAHFYLTHPQGLGTNANNEEISPCGGFMPTFTDTTDYYVGGDAINVVTSHPQVNMLFRATLDTTAQGNWSVLYPVIATYGLGSFCIPTVPAPKEFAGKNGVVQVIQNGEDGLLFQVRNSHSMVLVEKEEFPGIGIEEVRADWRIVLIRFPAVRSSHFPGREVGPYDHAL
jgi:hypothetical protein